MKANNKKAALKQQKIDKFIRENSLDGEQWKPVEGSGCDYLVSSAGRVLSSRRKEPQLLKPQLTGSNYYYVKIYGRNKRIHKLVAAAFLEPPPPGCRWQIHHINRNALDNSAANLVYLSPKEHSKIHRDLEAQDAAAAQDPRRQEDKKQ